MSSIFANLQAKLSRVMGSESTRFDSIKWLGKAALSLAVGGTLFAQTTQLHAADDPTPAQALGLKPIQKDVVFETPAAADFDSCEVTTFTDNETRGWLVKDDQGAILRRFLDTNRDSKLDRWCYYKNGVEVYRDIDANFNGKADQYRWMGTGGIRWGVDTDEDGTIDNWRMISAEEVTAEIVAAIRERDRNRFQRVLISVEELRQLGLGEKQLEEITTKITNARNQFDEFARAQSSITTKTKWLHFGGTQPGLIPAGTDGAKRDLIVYDNVAAIVETDGQHDQLAIGTLVQVGDSWRALELPEMTQEGVATTNGGIFYQASVAARTPVDDTGSSLTGNVEAIQKLLTRYDELDQELAKTTRPADQARLNGERAAVLAELAMLAEDTENRMNWIRQFADTVSGAYQTGEYPDGLMRLRAFETSLEDKNAGQNAIAYVHYRYLNAKYTTDIQKTDADLAEIQQAWLQQLADFVKAHPSSEHVPDAMLQLALAEEFAGEDAKAIAWYRQIVNRFPRTEVAKKATGAQRRLSSVGRSIRIEGTTLQGRSFDSSSLRGRVVIVHYWASWSDLCKSDLEVLKDLHAKYGRRGAAIVGVNLDSAKSQVETYLRSAPLPWTQLHEDGGLESKLANDMGIVTLPTILLIGKDGKVISRNITAAELDAELGKQLR